MLPSGHKSNLFMENKRSIRVTGNKDVGYDIRFMFKTHIKFFVKLFGEVNWYLGFD